MSKPGLAVVWSMLVAGATGFARADEPSSLGIGGRVRVHSSSLPAPFVGTLTAFDHESLAIEPEGGGEPSIFARRDVERLERRVRPSRKREGALLGLAVGFGLGFAGTFVLCEMFGTSCPVEAGVVYGSLYGAAAGAAGAGIGALVAPGDRWAEVPFDPVRPTRSSGAVRLRVLPMAGQRRGVVVAVSWR